MNHYQRRGIVRLLLAFSLLPVLALGACESGTQDSGALYRICMPGGTWNGGLVLFAHGYVAPNEPLAIPDDELTLPDGTYLPDVINKLGLAFATTSFRKNGLAVTEGIADLLDLVTIFGDEHGTPNRVLLTGASEGGLMTVKAVEEHPEVFSGGLAACGPIGDFQSEINHLGDARVLFDYFFPNVLTPNWSQGTPIPNTLINGWDATYKPKVLQALQSRPLATLQLISTSNLAVGLDPASVGDAVTSVLFYNIEGANDASTELGGNPFDNRTHYYSGSLFDAWLNARVRRFDENPTAATNIALDYETTGVLTRPIITLHTTSDPVVPYWHETLYAQKAANAGASSHLIQIPVLRYGHCNFTGLEVVGSFVLLSIVAH
jgi:pimeloyl-ACP methyl ester carboxylesterase